MTSLVDFTSYADAQTHYSKDRLWELFDGTRERFNIAHECIDRLSRYPLSAAACCGRQQGG